MLMEMLNAVNHAKEARARLEKVFVFLDKEKEFCLKKAKANPGEAEFYNGCVAGIQIAINKLENKDEDS